MNTQELRGLVAFFRLAERLKTVRRQGWLDRGIAEPESTADHSWGVALCAWLMALERSELDAGRVLLLALVHDLPEVIAGDTTPFDRHRSADGTIPEGHFRDAPAYDERESTLKRERERSALIRMTQGLPATQAAAIVDAWEEYAVGATAEARFVRQVDKLETLLQAELYLATHPEIVIDSFRLGAMRDVIDPGLRQLLQALDRVSE